MRARWWWLRLQLWQWLNAWRVQPLRRTVFPLCWFVAAMAVPAGISLAGPAPARAVLEWILSIDIPLALLVAVQVGSAAVGLASRRDMESWISAQPGRAAVDRMLRMLRWWPVARWPAGLAFAALILAWGDAQSTQGLVELLLLPLLGGTCGALFAWNVMAGSRVADDPASRATSRVSGWTMLSRIPFQQTSRRLPARRVAFLATPVMLAAPMGSLVQQIAGAIAAWVLLLYVSTWMREASRTVVTLRRWMPHSRLAPLRLYWLVWRYVILAALLSIAALWVGGRVFVPGSSRAPS